MKHCCWEMGFYTHVDKQLLSLSFIFVFIGWSWDRTIVIRFFIFFSTMLWSFSFSAVQSMYEIPSALESSKGSFLPLKALKSIQELTICTVKRMIDGTGRLDSGKRNESIAQGCSNVSTLHVQNQSHLRPLIILRKNINIYKKMKEKK